MKISKIMARIEYECKIRRIKREEMCAAMCISQGTYYNRRRDPSQLTLGEIHLAAKKLHMQDIELLA